MGLCYSKIELRKKPSSGLFIYDEEQEKIVKNIIGKIDFKELFLKELSPEFLKLFKENTNLFYSQSFLEGICYEYGLFNKSKDIVKAFKSYQDGADFKSDYLCMYRMHRIFLTDYKDFGLERNADLDRLYLYKCYAFLPYLIIDRSYSFFCKIDVTNEISLILHKLEDSSFTIFDKFMNFLLTYKNNFNLTKNDIKLMKYVVKGQLGDLIDNKDLSFINEMLNFEKGDAAFYEAKLKYCNFYLEHSGENCDKKK